MNNIKFAVDEKVIIEAMKELGTIPYIFQSEMQFQFELAWIIKKKLELSGSNVNVIFEYATLNEDKEGNRGNKNFTDLIFYDNVGNYIAIELKYKTLPLIYDGFTLGDHQARDLGRYDYLYDVVRLQKLSKISKLNEAKGLKNFVKGYALLLTNDSLYWEQSKTDTTKYSYMDFCISKYDTITANTQMCWNGKTANDITWRKCPITIERNYMLSEHWHDYSVVITTTSKQKPTNRFRYLLLDI